MNEEDTVKGIVLGVIVGILLFSVMLGVLNDFQIHLGYYNENVSFSVPLSNLQQQEEYMNNLSTQTQKVFNGTEVDLTTIKESTVSLLKIIFTAPQNLIGIFANMNSISGGLVDTRLIGWSGTFLLILLGLSILFIILKVFI